MPGVPDVSGHADIAKSCATNHGEVNPLVSFQELNVPVNSWDMSKRTAFRWTINGVKTEGSTPVSADAISAFFQDKSGLIKEAWSFYDAGAVAGKQATKAPANISAAIDTYVRLGGTASLLPPTSCKDWVALYATDGVSNEPGVPPNAGHDKLMALCQSRGSKWKTLVPAVQLALPVMSWDMHGRVAFRWTLAGVDLEGKKHVVPAITVFFLDQNMKITDSWDWWNTDLIPN